MLRAPRAALRVFAEYRPFTPIIEPIRGPLMGASLPGAGRA
jgi:hypothetical protein